MILIGLKRCSTCRKIEKTLDELQLNYSYRQIDQDTPSVEELKKWQAHTQLPLKRFFNTSGQVYRQIKLKDRWDELSDDEKFDLLAQDGMLVKRPILLTDQGEVYVGPDVRKYLESLAD